MAYQQYGFLGKIERKLDFEKYSYKDNVPFTEILVDNDLKEDELLDDSAIACKTNKGLVIITGCSHSGICNIIEYAKKICKEDKILDIIGGFHLMNANESRLNKVCQYLKSINVKHLHMCHCSDFQAKKRLSEVLSVKEAGAGLILEY